MNASLNILIIEVALVLLVIVCILVFFIWKRKKTRGNEFEQLLDNVESLQDERKAQLAQFLIKDYALDADEAKESGEYMAKAEKQFIQQFIKQQLSQETVADFYANLCELLDQYLYFVPKGSAEESVSVENKDNVPENADTQEVAEVVENAEVSSSVAGSETEQEPDWGDAFSESGDEMDADAKEGYEAGLEGEK